MADDISKEKRSEIMRSVKSHGNLSTELRLISIFKTFKIKGWRRKYRLIGNPDFTFPKDRIVVFADGCFWHGHDCRKKKPKTNSEYWQKKIKQNMERDERITKALQEMGWKVIRLWECEIKEALTKGQLPTKLKTERRMYENLD